MSPRIQELDGLPAGEIRLLVTQSEQRIMGAVDERLAAQDEKLDAMQEDLSVLVGTSKLTGLVQSMKESIDGGIVRQEAWHEQDLTFRSGVEDRLTNLQTDTANLTEQMKGIRWLVVCSRGMKWSASKAGVLFKTDGFWKWGGGAAVLWAGEHLAPRVYHWLAAKVAVK